MTDWKNFDDWLDENIDPDEYDTAEELREALKEHFEGEALKHAEEYAEEHFDKEVIEDLIDEEIKVPEIPEDLEKTIIQQITELVKKPFQFLAGFLFGRATK